MKNICLILCTAFCFSLLASNEDTEIFTKPYTSFEIYDNRLANIGFGCRQLIRNNCFDWNIAAGRPYRYANIQRFFPITVATNYLYFLPKVNTYFGIGAKFRIECSKNNFVPFEVNPCLTWGFLTRIKDQDMFIELKSNFLRYVKLFTHDNCFQYNRSYRNRVFKSHYFSVNFGTYF